MSSAVVCLRWFIHRVERIGWHPRLQNSPPFCVLKYARAVKQKVWSEAEIRERDWGESFFFLSPHTPYGRVRLSRFARVRLLRQASPISLLILRKKNRLFCSLVDTQYPSYKLSWCIFLPFRNWNTNSNKSNMGYQDSPLSSVHWFTSCRYSSTAIQRDDW